MENIADLLLQAPIAFKLPHLKADVLLKVFYTEFHVHSIVLKLHSEFFRRFLDSPDKVNVPAGARFQYEYVTVLDKSAIGGSEDTIEEDSPNYRWNLSSPNNGWNLEVASKADSKNIAQIPEDSNDLDLQRIEVDNFGKLLRAMYGLPCQFNQTIFEENTRITEQFVDMAEYFGALPMASIALYSMLCQRPPGISEIRLYLGEWLQIAIKTQHETLFKDCIIILAAQKERSVYQEKTYAKLKPETHTLVEKVRHGILKKIHLVMQYFIIVTSNSEMNIVDFVDYLDCTDPLGTYPFYRNLNASVSGGEFSEDASDTLSPLLNRLMENNLALLHYRTKDNDEKIWSDQFLCGEVTDEDLPWKPWGEA